jgi:hypothetical protein
MCPPDRSPEGPVRRPVPHWCRVVLKYLGEGLYWSGVAFGGMVPPPARSDDVAAESRYGEFAAEPWYDEFTELWWDEQSRRRR